jgi:hypothetical protein
MKYKVKKEQIKANLDFLADLVNVKETQKEQNLYIINTPKGKVKLKSDLSHSEFLSSLKNNKKQ